MELQLIRTMETELQANRPCVLATIVARAGSAPRGVGTAMLVSKVGEQTGTVGGGSLEFRVRQDALFLLTSGDSLLKQYAIHTDDSIAQSGVVTILFRQITGKSGASLCAGMRRALETGESAYLVCRISQEHAAESDVISTPELLSRCGLSCPPEQAVFTQGEPCFFVEPLLPAPRVFLFGGGHVAQCMARQLDLLEYRTWVVEDREAFATPSLFPAAERVILSEYDCAEAQLDLNARDRAIVMSRGHETDFEILRWLIKVDLEYIGCIGSRKKIALLREKLLAEGIAKEQIDKLHAPIGLPIGAETPAQIAVSVAAELIQLASCNT